MQRKDLKMSKIVLLEDDLSLRNGLSFAFKKQGFDIQCTLLYLTPDVS